MTAVSAEDLAQTRTLLFVPGHRPELFAKAANSRADGIVLDLEDAVSPEHKDVARENVRRWLADGGIGVVRINDVSSPWYEADVAALAGRPQSVMLPKVSGRDQVSAVLDRLAGGSWAVPIIETATGVFAVREICASPMVVRVALGSGDLASELGVDHDNRNALAYARSAIVHGSAAAGVAPPLDGVTTHIAAQDLVLADTRHAAEMGFTGKLCIHPNQISAVHSVFEPSADDVCWAERVVAAYTGSVGIVDGQMIDKPIVDRAQQLLARSRE